MELLPSHAEEGEVPAHIAVIMDGNGRWAKRMGLPRTAGHKRGVDAVQRLIDNALDFGVRHLTLYGFSSENWKRPLPEVMGLMGLLRIYLRAEVAALSRKGVRIRFIGERERLEKDIIALIDGAEETTRANTRLTLTMAVSYGGRGEIVRAARLLAVEVAAGRMAPGDIDEAAIARHLYAPDLPDPDLVIRTSGEQRLSNFLLWQSAYSELFFVDTLWPEFGREDFERAIAEYRNRDRRYGASSG